VRGAVRLCILGLLAPPALAAQGAGPADASLVEAASTTPRAPLFYRESDSGSTTSFGPLSFILNRGLHFARAKHGSVDVTGIPAGRHTLWIALSRPVWSVQSSGGFRHWAATQLLPARFDGGSAWAVNYTGHLVEAGVGYVTMRERFEAAGIPHASLWAHLTVMGSSFLSELYEASERQEAYSSTVADFYVFEPLGHVLFSIDGFARFFAETLNTRIWPHQAGVSVITGEFLNTGLDMIVKVPIPGVDDVSLFGRMGMGSDWGFSFHRPGGWDYSMGIGFAASDPTTDPLTGDELVRTVLSGSFFLDRDDSLLASVHASATRGRRLTVNLYPGSLGFLTSDFGLWFLVTEGNDVQFGISHRSAMGLGLGL
jgi:hypothetical protein